jgi:periplasmic protein TonB
MKIRHIIFLVINFIFILTSSCNGDKRIHPITKICLESEHRSDKNFPDVAIEIDSSLTYKFFGGDNAAKQGFMEGKISIDFWDTIQAKFTHLQYWNFKEYYGSENDLIPLVPILPYTMNAVIYYGDTIKHINLEHVPNNIWAAFFWLMNTYENVDLKRLPTGRKLSFDIQLPDTQKIYYESDISQKPSFRSNQDSLSAYLSANLNYPKKAKKEGIETTVYVTFVIEKDGTVSNAKMLRDSLGKEDFNTEVLRVINSMPKWNPGKKDGMPVRVEMILPVRFKLE